MMSDVDAAAEACSAKQQQLQSVLADSQKMQVRHLPWFKTPHAQLALSRMIFPRSRSLITSVSQEYCSTYKQHIEQAIKVTRALWF
jgi:hypothetical protein